jgi:hypothetical protein
MPLSNRSFAFQSHAVNSVASSLVCFPSDPPSNTHLHRRPAPSNHLFPCAGLVEAVIVTVDTRVVTRVTVEAGRVRVIVEAGRVIVEAARVTVEAARVIVEAALVKVEAGLVTVEIRT